MAIMKIWSERSDPGSTICYAEDLLKTSRSESRFADLLAAEEEKDREDPFGSIYCTGIHCCPETAREQFMNVKLEFGKTDGIQTYHGILSFREQDLSPELAHQIGVEYARRVWGDRFQVVVTTHLNTAHLHCHFVINSVSFRDGKRLSGNERWWAYCSHIAYEICEKYHLKGQEGIGKRYINQKEQAGMPTRYNVARAAIDEAISMSTNRLQLEDQLRQMGYTFCFDPGHKYWTLRIPDDLKPIRLYHLGPEYTRDRIMERLNENRQDPSFRPVIPKPPRPRQYRLPTRYDRACRMDGLCGLYLQYCCRLGLLPGYRTPNATRMPPLIRRDLIWSGDLLAETAMLTENRIRDRSELADYRKTSETALRQLEQERGELRKRLHRKTVPEDEKQEIRERIGAIREQSRQCRQVIKRCDSILSRSEEIRHRFELVKDEEEIQKRKELTRDEYKR